MGEGGFVILKPSCITQTKWVKTDLLTSTCAPPPLQACDGTISQLRQFLVEMERFDAVNIIDSALEGGVEGGVASTGTEREQESSGGSSVQQGSGKSAPGKNNSKLCSEVWQLAFIF